MDNETILDSRFNIKDLVKVSLGVPLRCNCFVCASLWNQRPKKDAGGYV
jgi:hypothetical protein